MDLTCLISPPLFPRRKTPPGVVRWNRMGRVRHSRRSLVEISPPFARCSTHACCCQLLLWSASATFRCVVGCLSCAWSLARLLTAAADIVAAWCTYLSFVLVVLIVWWCMQVMTKRLQQQVDVFFFLWGNTLVFRFPLLATFIHMVVVDDICLCRLAFCLERLRWGQGGNSVHVFG